MNLQNERRDAVELIKVCEDRIDAASAVQFKDSVVAIARTLDAAGPSRVVLDLEQVNFLDSSGLGAVVAVMKAFAPDRRLELAGLSPLVAKVFRLTRMDQVFVIHPSAEDATAA